MHIRAPADSRQSQPNRKPKARRAGLPRAVRGGPWAGGDREDLARAARVEVVLVGDRGAAVAVAAAVGHEQEDGVVAVLRVGLGGAVDLADALVDDGDGPRVEVAVAPVDVIGILVV